MDYDKLHNVLWTSAHWNFNERSIDEFVKFLKQNWHHADDGYLEYEYPNLRLSTAGWSDNELIIKALQENYIFWNLCWRKSEFGGHYYFEIYSKFKRE